MITAITAIEITNTFNEIIFDKYKMINSIERIKSVPLKNMVNRIAFNHSRS